MNAVKLDSQVETLYHHLRQGVKVDRVWAFQELGIADLRSRISDCQRDYDIVLDRETVPGKRYRRYFIKEKQLKLEL
jgi:hypothetical protein